MDIGSAKEQIKNTIQIYLLKNPLGQYRLPVVHQRPVFLLGAPGLGKTAIMQQIADELDIGLVSYSMTHHTRQSALGLPVIVEKEFDGQKYTVSEYTMSEIIASIYECMRKTGKREGILFLDEINCVSETLSPSMLLFLQYKLFGGHQIPDGWVVVTAGNPARFNKSVREFDAATRDRLKVMEVEPDYEAWKKYAVEQRISRSVISYLDIRQDDFYRVETTVDGLMVVTPRAWEDLSEMVQYYEELELPVGYELISQYLQNKQTARDFAVYYELYQKYRQVYHIGELLQGIWEEDTVRKAGEAKIDERMSLVSLLLEGVFGSMKKCMVGYDALAIAAKALRAYREMKPEQDEKPGEGAKPEQSRKPVYGAESGQALAALIRMESEWRSQSQNAKKKDVEAYAVLMDMSGGWHDKLGDGNPYEAIKNCYQVSVAELKEEVKGTQKKIACMLKFLEEAFGKGTELGMAVNDLTVTPEATAFIGQFLSEEYFAASRDMLPHCQEEQLLKQIDIIGLA
ncbi:AAA family ATPase [Lachnospiraceae bacterium]|nr:AAA family ATPase [Lachnospiraceae bacterium]